MKKITTEAVRKDYAALADEYEIRWRHFNDVVRAWVMERFPDIHTGAILDLGCGTGTMLRLIHESHPGLRLTGVDVSPEMLALARQVVRGADIREGDVGSAGEGIFDVVLSLNVLHHLNHPVAHLYRLKKLCKPGGHIFLCDFSVDTIRLGITEIWRRLFRPDHYKAFRSKKLRSMIEASGLKIRDSAVLKPGSFWRLQIYKLAP